MGCRMGSSVHTPGDGASARRLSGTRRERSRVCGASRSQFPSGRGWAFSLVLRRQGLRYSPFQNLRNAN
jgi:hypothetical protein